MLRRVFGLAAAVLSVLVLGAIMVPLTALAQTAGDLSDVVSAACANDGQTLKWIFGTIASASLVANLRGALPRWLAPIVDLLALNLVHALQALAAQKDTAKKVVPMLLAFFVTGWMLVACTGDPQLDAAKVQGYIVAYQPIASEVACTAQAGWNVAGRAAEIRGDADAAEVASIGSLANGLFCNGLPAGSRLPAPVTVPAVPAPVGVAPAVAAQ